VTTVIDQQPVLVGCDLAQVATGGTCTPTIIANDMCWLGTFRLIVHDGYVYGVSQAQELCRARLP
jgi:hypothetical protein